MRPHQLQKNRQGDLRRRQGTKVPGETFFRGGGGSAKRQKQESGNLRERRKKNHQKRRQGEREVEWRKHCLSLLNPRTGKGKEKGIK